MNTSVKTELLSGDSVPEDESHKILEPNGMQKDYVVLSSEERAKGFVQPLRNEYVHLACNSKTVMSQKIAETYARDPWFYSGTFCCNCRAHFSLEEFVWTTHGRESLDPNEWDDEFFNLVISRKKKLDETK